ncbi:uncharacterized protein LOC115260807 [Aedes albopictus]|uniref:CCHC-type domain-containing protein n=1 Tax=Aedes albopictus TaxID=7160 RepID=A0ABM1YR22_AEDAL|nr:uncharacterized protein LOC115260807 [Aedes albopictus]
MAAASSGDPGGSVGRRLPLYLDPTNSFGELTYLQLSGKNGVTLPFNPYIIGKSVEACAGGEIEDAKSEAQGTKDTLMVRNPTQVTKLLKLTRLIDGTEVEVVPHPNLNVCRCIISTFDLIRMEEKDILAEMAKDNVIRVQRITRYTDGKKINTPALILTFCKTTYPETIKVGLRRVPTRPYIPNPMLCYGCFSYGHTRARCPGPQRCVNCSGEFHGDECGEATLCLNCKGDHRPTNRQCPVYKKEVEIIKVKVRDNLSFPEARKRVEQQAGSYAQVAAQQKDKEIARLQEESKQKDEKIERMMAVIEKMNHQTGQEKSRQNREQSVSREKPHSSREKRITTITTGPVTRSRTNSPAVKETKRGRSSKQNTNKPATSPDPSPPPKKTAISTHDLTQMDYSGEESEASETPPNQHLR